MKKKILKKKPEVKDFTGIEKMIKDVDDFPVEVKVVLYGKAGTGKTTLAASFPKPLLFIDCKERGTDSVKDVKGVKVIRAKNYEEIDQLYWYLKKNPTLFKTVVIDTMSNVQNLAIDEILKENKKEVSSGAGANWGVMTKQMWGQVSTKLKSVILDYRDLECNIVFIAHDRSFMEEDDGTEHIDPSVGPALMPSVVSVLNAAVSTIGNTFVRKSIKKIKVDKKTVVKKKNQYCLRIGPDAVYTTKVRKPKKFTLPEVIVDPDFDKLINIINGVEE